MQVYKKLILGIILLIDAYFLYATIGYLILGIQTPKILGGIKTTFMGMYMMSMTFGAIFIITTLILVFLWIRFKKKK